MKYYAAIKRNELDSSNHMDESQRHRAEGEAGSKRLHAVGCYVDLVLDRAKL